LDSQRTEKLLAQVAQRCRVAGKLLTVNREAVLRVLAARGEAMSAYEILAELKVCTPGIQPPTVYRALEFLIGIGVVHGIASRSRFILCNQLPPRHQQRHQAQLLICRSCNAIEEREMPASLSQALNESAAASGFLPALQEVEVHGLCRRCHSSSPSSNTDLRADHA